MLVPQAVEEMRKSDGFPMLVVAGWNARDQDMHVQMLAAQALARCRTLREVSEVAQQSGHGPWSLRFYHRPTAAPAGTDTQPALSDVRPRQAARASEHSPDYVPRIQTTFL